MTDKKNARSYALYPLLLAIFPIISFFAHNIKELKLAVIFEPLFYSICAAVAVWFTLRIIYKSWDKSSLAASALLLIFFSYGHIFDLLSGLKIGDFIIFRHRVLFPLLIILFLVAAYLIKRVQSQPDKLNMILNWVAATLVLTPILTNAGSFAEKVKQFSASDKKNLEINQVSAEDLKNKDQYPDIYYLIFEI